jgi:hypothetical protein
MTVGQLKTRLNGVQGHQLASKIVRCVSSVRGTRAYWSMEGSKLRDMISQIGTPTFFYTLSMADLSWPDLHALMPEDPFRPELSSNESYRIRARNVANNPHIVASYLSIRHRFFRETVLQHLGLADDCRLQDFWYRVEWQARGSGTLNTWSVPAHELRQVSHRFHFRPLSDRSFRQQTYQPCSQGSTETTLSGKPYDYGDKAGPSTRAKGKGKRKAEN